MRLTKEEMKNHPSKPFALCVTSYHHKIQVWTIADLECDILTASFDDGEIRKFKIQTDKEERDFFTIQGKRVYLDECVRYGTPWLASLD
jgi:hypothetical protein